VEKVVLLATLDWLMDKKVLLVKLEPMELVVLVEKVEKVEILATMD